MLLLLVALTQTPADTVLAGARRAVVRLTDTAAARAAGYRPITEVGVPDGLPFQGEHWQLPQNDTLSDVSLERPRFIMFGLVKGEYRRLGIAYSTLIRLEAPAPNGLGGDPTAKWHDHFWCDSAPGRPNGFLVNEPDQCISQGGSLNPRRISMVHVWTDIESPEGTYGHDNPALPFVALGLTPPSVHEYHDRARGFRKLSFALGEAYDARLPLTRRIEKENSNPALADSLRQRRTALVAMIPELRKSEADRAKYDQLAARIVAEWEAMLGIYERMASAELKPRVKRRHEQVIGVSAHH